MSSAALIDASHSELLMLPSPHETNEMASRGQSSPWSPGSRAAAVGSKCSMASARPPWVTSWAQATAAEEGLHPVWNDGDGLVEAAGARGSLGPARESLDLFGGVGSLDGSLEPCGSSH